MLLALPLLLAPAPAFADVPGKGWVSAKRITELLARRGAKVTKIEADDGHWEGEAIRRGVRYEFHADPRTGRLSKWQRDTD